MLQMMVLQCSFMMMMTIFLFSRVGTHCTLPRRSSSENRSSLHVSHTMHVAPIHPQWGAHGRHR